VLVVEDENALRGLLSEALGRAGFRVAALRHAAEVETWCPRAPFVPDVLLIDLHLPGEDGRSLAARLRRLWPGTRALLMSGHPGESGGEPGEEFLLKPFLLSELRARVTALLREAPRG